MNILSQFLIGYGLGICITYFIINTFFSEYHALDSNIIRKIKFIYNNKLYRLQPVIVKLDS